MPSPTEPSKPQPNTATAEETRASVLRSPTLRHLSGKMCSLLDAPGALVMAGIRVKERDDVLTVFRDARLQCEWTEEEDGWVDAVLKGIEQ